MPAKRDQDVFWEGVDRGVLVAQRCGGCGVLRHPPAPDCPGCGCEAWEAEALSGRGVIHTWIVSRHPSRPDLPPRLAILVDLEEGIRMASNLIDAENAKVGAPVVLEIGEVDGDRLPLFRTLAGQGGAA
jgi:uncharacterized OB-fold protein